MKSEREDLKAREETVATRQRHLVDATAAVAAKDEELSFLHCASHVLRLLWPCMVSMSMSVAVAAQS